MELNEYQNIFEHEESHFFYVVNHQLILSLVEQYFPHKKPLQILDAGCGTGLLLTKLNHFGFAQGVDISPEAIKFCRRRKVKAKQASLHSLPFEDNTFDLITSVDVLYHRQIQDQQALNELFRILKPGGILIIRLPANKWLKLAHDKHVHTRQRYTSQEISRKLTSANFRILKVSYVNAIFLLLAVLRYGIERIYQPKNVASGINSPNELINSALINLSKFELWWLKNHSLPTGLGVVAVGQRPK